MLIVAIELVNVCFIILVYVVMVYLKTDVQAGLAVYWWQRLITFGSSRIWVKQYMFIWNSLQVSLNRIQDSYSQCPVSSIHMNG